MNCYRYFSLVALKLWFSMFKFAKNDFFGKNGIIKPSYLKRISLNHTKSEKRLKAEAEFIPFFPCIVYISYILYDVKNLFLL